MPSARSCIARRAALLTLLLLHPDRADRAHAIGLGGWIRLPTHTGPSVPGWEPSVWNESANRLQYPDGSRLWTLHPWGEWTVASISGTRPDLQMAEAVFDAPRNRILRFGGVREVPAVGPGNDVWELTVGATPAWRKLLPAGTPPPPRTFSSMIIDVPGQRAIVFGGSDFFQTQFYNDVWALSLVGTNGTWTRLIANGAVGSPGARERHTAVFDPVRRRMVIFGGQGAGGTLNDVWALSLAGTPSWQSIATAGAPSRRSGHAAIYDAANDQMIVHGGNDPSLGSYTDAMALPLGGAAQWTALPSGPFAAIGHTAVHDDASNRMLTAVGTFTHALDLGPAPHWSFLERHIGPRTQMNAALAADTRTLVVTGGITGLGPTFNDLWTLDLTDHTASWVPTDLTGGPQGRNDMAMVWDPVRARILTFGGQGSGLFNDVWALTLEPTPAWTPVATGGATPPPSYGWRGVYDPSGDRLVFMAFHRIERFPPEGQGFQNWIAELPLSGANALQWTTHDVFPAEFRRRQGASFSYDAGRDVAWIFGGADSADVMVGNDVWQVSLAGAPTVAPVVTTGGRPSPRSDHAAMYDDARDRLLILGGRSSNTTVLNTFTYALEGGNNWTLLVTRGGGAPPTGRAWMANVYDAAAERLVIFGGTGSSSVLDDTWALSIGLETLPVEEAGREPGAIALAPIGANPMRGDVSVSLSLPAAGRGSLTLLDVAGRRVRAVSLDGTAAGTHVIPLAKRGEMRPGLYFAVLRHEGSERRARLIVLP